MLAFRTTGAGWKPFFKHDKSPTTNDVSSVPPLWMALVSLLLFFFSKSIIDCWLTFCQWLSETGGGARCDGECNESASDADCSVTDVRLKLAFIARWAAAIHVRAKKWFIIIIKLICLVKDVVSYAISFWYF